MEYDYKRSFQALKCLMVNFFNKSSFPSYRCDNECSIEILKSVGQREYKDIPKIIWMYWHDENVPKLVVKNVNNIINENPTFVVRLLNKESVKDYLPDLCFAENIIISHQTDIIRLLLLKKYGGIWVDATTIFYRNFDWLTEDVKFKNFDIIAYYRERSTYNFEFPIIESWFLCAPKNSVFISNWLDVLLPLKDIGSVNFFQQLIEREDYNEIKQGIINPDYLLVYLAEQISSRKNPLYNAYLIKSEASALFIQDYFNSNYKTNYYLCRVPVERIEQPIIKLCSGDRMFIDTFQKWGIIHSKSIIGRLLNDL